MTAKTRSPFMRIILIFVAAGMIAGLCYSAICNYGYDAVSGLISHQNVMSSPGLVTLPDYIADSTTPIDPSQYLTKEDRSGKQSLIDTIGSGYSGVLTRASLSIDSCIFLLYVLLCTSAFSFRYIDFIHLKDGTK